MLAGVPFVIAEGDGPIFQRVSIERVDMLRLCRLQFDHAAWPDHFSSEVILEDALEILNLTSKHRDVVFSKRVIGRMPKRIALNDVLDLATVYVSTTELMARTRKPPLTVRNFLNDSGLEQPYPGCWKRMSAEERLILASWNVSETPPASRDDL
ncbi:hypothetical protein QE385_002866 [Sphingomonas sp. SORGH_AS 950]|uniref:hypothetical protein n=1 Tax=Sphingomonas sp. SORGH_AS_0950 TaxID=3041792 RepID=UPI00278726D9|nr:hypothetical protein [Sphingomonas sp. SORGH_AS_0950]MDQ1158539.1 hypothetical protein [Sphingomonas sp. SORGH_AS_0950]